jgi:hypothetical protein
LRRTSFIPLVAAGHLGATRKARPLWLFAALAALAGCRGEPITPDRLSLAGQWTATVELATGDQRMSMTLAHEAGTAGVAGSGLWFDKHRPAPLDVESLTIKGALTGTNVTLIIAPAAGATLGTLNYSGSVVDDGAKMVGSLMGSRWSPPLRVEFKRP